MGAGTLGAAVLFLRRGPRDAGPARDGVPLRNPFSLYAAIRFALFFALILLLVALVRRSMSPQGMYLLAGLAGLTDVDAITLSMARLSREGTAAEVAGRAVVIAALANTAVKGVMVMMLGSRDLARRVTPALVVILLAGLGAAFLV